MFADGGGDPEPPDGGGDDDADDSDDSVDALEDEGEDGPSRGRKRQRRDHPGRRRRIRQDSPVAEGMKNIHCHSVPVPVPELSVLRIWIRNYCNTISSIVVDQANMKTGS